MLSQVLPQSASLEGRDRLPISPDIPDHLLVPTLAPRLEDRTKGPTEAFDIEEKLPDHVLVLFSSSISAGHKLQGRPDPGLQPDPQRTYIKLGMGNAAVQPLAYPMPTR